MNFAGKAYIKKKKADLPPIKEENLEESKQLPEPPAPSAPPLRIRRQRSYEALSVGSLDHSLGSSSEEERELPDRFEDYLQAQPELDRGKEVYNVRVDTNVVSLTLGSLEQESMVATGDPVFCSQCSSALSCHSKVYSVSDRQVWVCEFCDNENCILIEEEEMPRADTLDYMLQSQIADSQQLEGSHISVIFCIDVSWSMCVTEAVAAKLKLKTHKNADLGGFADYEMNEQFMPGEENLTYVSRLECVQAAIESQLSTMSTMAPDRKVGLVTFNSDVCIIGDGTTEPYILTGDKLNSFQVCLDTGMSWQSKMAQTIEHTKDSLASKLLDLKENGPTALGPALVTSLGLVNGGKPGSKVIICTDGLANIGIGRLDEDSGLTEANEFYTAIGNLAKSKGIEVSVISIEGEQCKLSQLSKVSELTGGEMTRVTPANISNEFANILMTPVIATQVQVIVKLHKGLTFRYQEDLQDPCTLVKELGNVTAESEFTFEYSLKDLDEIEALGIDLNELKKIPFQSQIHYTNPQGMRLMRVISCLQDITDDLDEASSNLNFEVLGVNAAQRSAQLASKGEYREAQTVMRSWKRMMNRNARSSEQQGQMGLYLNHMTGFNRGLNNEIVNEEEAPVEREMLMRQRQAARDDHSSHMVFRAQRANKKASKDCVVM